MIPRHRPLFLPRWPLTNPHVQSLLAGASFRHWYLRRRTSSLAATAQSWRLDCGEGVRLTGLYNPAPGESAGLVVLLHGWEGSAESPYMLACAQELQRRHYDVFRLNFRDHGDTHGLNRDIFHSCRLEEVVGALKAVAERAAPRALDLIGFSLGGNFALRAALRAPAAGIPLHRVIAVSPPVDPYNALQAMLAAPRFYQQHFIFKWRRSLRRKQECYPEHYQLDEWFRMDNLADMTEYLACRYAGFHSLRHYLDGYSLAGGRMSGLAVDTTLITAEDDPIIPAADARAFFGGTDLKLHLTPHGGHCAFLEALPLKSWLVPHMGELLTAAGGKRIHG